MPFSFLPLNSSNDPIPLNSLRPAHISGFIAGQFLQVLAFGIGSNTEMAEVQAGKPTRSISIHDHITQLFTEPSVGDEVLEENTRRNSLQIAETAPDTIHQIANSALSQSSCPRCSGEGIVPKPCRFCKATGELKRPSSCLDCNAAKNGCGNRNCESCEG